ncbi:MAG: M12 family metallo-peptidase [Bacteroidota bacterium]|nr:M12 family metallo-peptidase [Bacteroidota bacterium]
MKNLVSFSLLIIAIFFMSMEIGSYEGGKIKIGNNLYAKSNSSNSPIWTDIAEGSFIIKGEKRIQPQLYRTVKANFTELQSELLPAPFEFTERAKYSPLIIDLPSPSGSLLKYFVTEYSMMEPELASKYPGIKTYNVKGIDDPYATGKLDITSSGFHAMIFSARGDYSIDPYSTGEKEVYICYYKSNLISNQSFDCLVNEIQNFDNSNGTINCGPQLRTYRLALAATYEYTLYHGGTVVGGMAAIVTAMNRVNGVYEKDAAVRMVLVSNNDLIVYATSADPYTNNNGGAMLGQNQNNIDQVIGPSNYDIGHVFSTGGGGVAGLGVVCVNGQNARGVTGLPQPNGDPFYIDYVAHEMGHQYGGNHTFNSVAGNCGFGNRNGSTAWEPGSGSTIMAYAGICSGEDLQNFSDAYFHTGSFTEIGTFTQFGNGSICPVITNTGNTPPTVSVPASGFTIPKSTPFKLTGSATDLESPNSLTYCWEEFDLGPPGSPNNPSENAPIVRSLKPDTLSYRYVPRISNLVNNTFLYGERLPTYARTMSFRLTARDNSIAGGGVEYEFMQFEVDTAGPFLVTQPNTNVTWNSNSPQTVIWNIANTNASPVNCQFVNILLSTNGGIRFDTTLVSNTANDGSEIINLPSINITNARIKVESVGNIFYDISNANFTITSVSSVQNNGTGIPNNYLLSQNFPNPFNPSTKINFDIPFNGKVTLKIMDITGREVTTLVNNSYNAGSYTVTFEPGNLASGIYFYNIVAEGDKENFVMTKKMTLIK